MSEDGVQDEVRRAARKGAGGVGSDDAILIARQALISTEKEQP